MTLLQQAIVLLYGLINLAGFIKGFHEVKEKKNVYGLARHYGFLGIFVWGDVVLLGPFWLIICVLVLFVQDWFLFLVFLSLFWAVRSAGEAIYWISEQFTDKHRNPPHTLKYYKLFNNDAIWFEYQIFWQCILVISLIASIYFSSLWLQTKF